eukprot:563645-Lingulodinium_polyedra.AAC.1
MQSPWDESGSTEFTEAVPLAVLQQYRWVLRRFAVDRHLCVLRCNGYTRALEDWRPVMVRS